MGSSSRLPVIACSLDVTGQHARLGEWREVISAAVPREEIAEGVRYTFVADEQAEQHLRDLAAAEHGCCSFLEFEITRRLDQVVMTVTAPPDGLDALRVVFRAEV